MTLSCLLFSPELLAQAPAGTVNSDNRSNVYLVVEFHTYSCGSGCSPDDYVFYGSQYDFPDNDYVTHTFAQDPCGTPLDAADIMAITFTEFTGGGGSSASWTMSFCDLDNLWTYGSKMETYYSPGFGVFFNVEVSYTFPGPVDVTIW